MSDFENQVTAGNRFEFGKNWKQFLATMNEARLAEAEKSLSKMLGVGDLTGKKFLDIGSGSGLFSLAARRLGAEVYSFDYDPNSVACTAELKQRYFPDDLRWTVEEGSALDRDYLTRLGKFDIVYSWGVLHHTGQMWTAIENAALSVAPSGLLFIAIYNDQGVQSRIWTGIKQTYNRLPGFARPLLTVPYFCLEWGFKSARDLAKGKPFSTWKTYYQRRGMSPWFDVVDWVGGYPFEVATSEALTQFVEKQGFQLTNSRLVGKKLGCNELVFKRA